MQTLVSEQAVKPETTSETTAVHLRTEKQCCCHAAQTAYNFFDVTFNANPESDFHRFSAFSASFSPFITTGSHLRLMVYTLKRRCLVSLVVVSHTFFSGLNPFAAKFLKTLSILAFFPPLLVQKPTFKSASKGARTSKKAASSLIRLAR